jgi:DNA-binding PadR family transcriptional regulator
MGETKGDADGVRWDGFKGLDKLLDHRVRLALCVLLARYKRLTFTRLKELLEESDGSLGAHLSKLEGAGYVGVKKEFRGRRPVSWYALRPAGRRVLQKHVAGLHELLRHTQEQ